MISLIYICIGIYKKDNGDDGGTATTSSIELNSD
jgi:hypothetical protein